MPSVFLTIARQVLLQQDRPLSAREIIAIAENEQLLPDNFAGKTPHQTLKSKLSTSIRRSGGESEFVRTAPGRFYLRELLDENTLVYEAPPQHPPSADEDVLTFSSAVLDELGRFQGVRVAWKRYLHNLLNSRFQTLDRYAAESTEEYKQVITYVLVTRGRQILAYRRGSFNRVEHFLRGSDCVGFGGHVKSLDRNLLGENDHGIVQGALRELREELDLPDADRRKVEAGVGLEVIGLLNDDSSAVGRRHFAVILRYEASDDEAWDRPRRAEKAITQLRWLVPSRDTPLNDFEYWSQLCLLTYYPAVTRGEPSVKIRKSMPLRRPHVLCVVGQIGSGKTEAAEILHQDLGYAVVNTGQVLAGVLRRAAVTEGTRHDFQENAQAFIGQPGGPERLAREIVDEVTAAGSPDVVVDGLRQRATFESLRRLCRRRVALLYVHAPAHVAYELYKARSGEDRSVFEFARAREAPVESETQYFISVADAVLFNWHGRSGYRRALLRFLAAHAERLPRP